MWRASLELGADGPLRVKLYAAIEDRAVHFRLLHAEDGVPVRQQMIDPRSGEEVAAADIQRGLEVEKGVLVVLTPDEIASLEPAASRSIHVTRFVPASALDLSWYRRPYLLGPDGDPESYFALARALRESGRHGIARWVMRGKAHAGALAARGDHLALIAFRRAEEVVTAPELERPEGPPVSHGERKLAEQLVSALDAPFEPAALRDEYRERLRAWIAARAEGRTPEVVKERVSEPRTDLRAALRESLRIAKERRVA